MSLLGTIYGGEWSVKEERNVSAELEAELKGLNAKINNVMVVLSQIQRKNDDGSVTVLKNADGSIAMSKSLCLNLVSTTEKTADGDAKPLGQVYKRLSRKSSLETGQLVDPKSIKMIVTERLGETREFFDGDVLATN